MAKGGCPGEGGSGKPNKHGNPYVWQYPHTPSDTTGETFQVITQLILPWGW